ncbi:sterol 3-beta-glucosyltransferase ugt80b1 [Quercus suber]|uniref:Sterol 3-beta-glucosyltransferase ugt80b1 n=1 Tax=Quercus suber TaxID=58331 RepID=A0AAW0LMD2_QUESU
MEAEMEMEERSKPIAIFMAFGTKGDVYPIANLGHHLAGKHVAYHPVLSPPVLSTDQNHETTTGSGLLELSFSLQKRMVTKEHRRECYSLVQRIFGCGQSLDGDFIVINFFALEGWSLAETFRVRCIVAAPYVVPYSAPSSFERHFKKELPLLYRYLQEATTNKVGWKDVIHWMWPLFTDSWGSWRCDDLNLSPCPFTILSFVNMGFLKYPQAFLHVLQTVIEITSYRFILFTAGFEALDAAVRMIVAEASSCSSQTQLSEDCISLFSSQLFCFTGYFRAIQVAVSKMFGCNSSWGQISGTTAAALHAGIPQVVCPFMLDQFYWAERMFWLGVAPEPLKRDQLLPDKNDDMSIREAANVLSRAINDALSPKVKACAIELAERISLENGVLEAVKTLKEELGCPD